MLEGRTTLAQFIIEQAGGRASTGRGRILEVLPLFSTRSLFRSQ